MTVTRPSLWPRVEPLLAHVEKPARYIGGELGAIEGTDDDPGRIGWLLVYPDTYEIGLPNQGLQILYEILNERADAVAERAYAPWQDMEAQMRANGLPLFSLEGHRAARSFDVIAFNWAAELTATNILNLIDLAGVPVRANERRAGDPLVFVGGHCAFNPEPMADFVNAFVLGDGEEVVGELCDLISRVRAERADTSRDDLVEELATVPGVYVPKLYESAVSDGRLVGVRPRLAGVPEVVEKRTVADLAQWPYPKAQLVPLIEVVHDRLNVEIFRGCTRGCRFCQAGMITRPVRERPLEQVEQMVSDGIARTGYDEVALTSLSSADFSGIEQVVADVVNGGDAACGRVSVSLPSLRVDAFTVGLASEIQRVRRTGLTFAPEGGTWRMRQVINKLISEEDLYSAVDAAFSQGWRRVKLYFLIGLPTETDDDVLGIVRMAGTCVEIGRRYQRSVTVTASVGGFVPKAHTPFQWFGQNPEVELRRKVNLLKDAARKIRGLSLRWHDPAATTAEGIVSRGDRRTGAVIEHVWKSGGTFQEWSERFDLRLWEEGLTNAGMTFGDAVHRHRESDEPLAWDHISAGLHRDFLWQDYMDAVREQGLEDCRWTPCYDCGACTGFGIEHVVAANVPPAGGSQGTGQDLSAGGMVPVRLVPTPARIGPSREGVRDFEPASVASSGGAR